MIDRFSNPFSQVFFSKNLETPNRMFDFVMKMFSEGDAAFRIRYGRNPKTTSYSIACRFLYNTKVVDIRETHFTSSG
jgi:hypothetical protein